MLEIFPSNLNFDRKNGHGLVFQNLHGDHKNDPTIVWFDLHVSGKSYKLPDLEGKEYWRKFRTEKDSKKKLVGLPSGQSIVIQTKELVGTGEDLTGIILGSAGRSLKGLLITSGKIDPNFGPQSIVLNVENCSGRTIYIYENDKIATVAFLRLNKNHAIERVRGPAEAADEDKPSWLARAGITLEDLYRKYRGITIWSVSLYLLVVLTQAEVRYLGGKGLEWVKETFWSTLGY